MIICKYRDGSSIRVYRSDGQRKKAIFALDKMGFVCVKLANCLEHYSLKAIPRQNIIQKEHIETLLKLFRQCYNFEEPLS